LKLQDRRKTQPGRRSPPSWRRGLKPCDENGDVYCHVASLVEAWIETWLCAPRRSCQKSPPSWRRGLKPARARRASSIGRSPPSWRRGLKLSSCQTNLKGRKSPPSWRRGLKRAGMACRTRPHVASLVEAWIETGSSCCSHFHPCVASLVEAWIETSTK